MRLILLASALFACFSVAASAAELGAELGAVEERSFTMHEFRLVNGAVMHNVTISYETYGHLAPDGRNAVLITHGYTSSHHAAGRSPANDNHLGWWDKLIGPGKPIDTDKVFVVSSNMLGSSFGSTNGGSVNPDTGKPYGPDFPPITVHDIVAAEKALLDNLGVKHLVAVAGPSFGGYQAFEWAVDYPDAMDGVVAVVTAPRSTLTQKSVEELKARLATDPQWNGGWYYDRGGAKTSLTDLRVETLKRYGIEAALALHYPDPATREAQIRKRATEWAAKWDANSLVILRRATIGFDTVPQFPKIKAKLLYVLCRTDKVFPPAIAQGYMLGLQNAGVDAHYYQIDSELGHSASGADADKWAPTLREFLAPLLPHAS